MEDKSYAGKRSRSGSVSNGQGGASAMRPAKQVLDFGPGDRIQKGGKAGLLTTYAKAPAPNLAKHELRAQLLRAIKGKAPLQKSALSIFNKDTESAYETALSLIQTYSENLPLAAGLIQLFAADQAAYQTALNLLGTYPASLITKVLQLFDTKKAAYLTAIDLLGTYPAYPAPLATNLFDLFVTSDYADSITDYGKAISELGGDKQAKALAAPFYSEYRSTYAGQASLFWKLYKGAPLPKIDDYLATWQTCSLTPESQGFLLKLTALNIPRQLEEMVLAGSAKITESPAAIESVLKILPDENALMYLDLYRGFNFDEKLVNETYKTIQTTTDRKKTDAISRIEVVHQHSKPIISRDEKGWDSNTELNNLFSSGGEEKRKAILKQLGNKINGKELSKDEIATFSKNEGGRLYSTLVKGIRAELNKKSLKEFESVRFKLKVIDSYYADTEYREVQAKENEKTERAAQERAINQNPQYETDALAELVNYLQAANYHGSALELLKKLDLDLSLATQLVSKVESAQLDTLVTLDSGSIKGLASFSLLDQLLRFINQGNGVPAAATLKTLKEIGLNHFNELVTKGVKPVALSRASAAISTFRTRFAEAPLRPLLFDYLSSERDYPQEHDTIFSQSKEAELSLYVTITKKVKEDASGAFKLAQEITNPKKELYNVTELTAFVNSLGGVASSEAFQEQILSKLLADVKTKIGGKGDRFTGSTDGGFGLHMQRIDYLLAKGKLKLWMGKEEEENENLLVTNYEAYQPGLFDSKTKTTGKDKRFFAFTRHVHPHAKAATIGNTEASKAHFKPNHYVDVRMKSPESAGHIYKANPSKESPNY